METKLYKKNLDRQAYLHRKSEHPESLKRSIPFSQNLRFRASAQQIMSFRIVVINYVTKALGRKSTSKRYIKKVAEHHLY